VTDSPTAAVSPPPRYPVVLFDLDNTLSDFTSAQSEALPGLLAAHGVAEAESYLPTFKRLAEPLWEQIEAGTLTLDTLNGERFRLLVEHTDIDVDPSVLASKYLGWLSTSGRLIPGAIDLLEALHGTVRMGMITNGYAEVQRPRLERFELTHYFESVTVSSEIGHAKPAQAFFDVALRQLGNPDPATVLVVGDSLSSDIAGGANAGCATCWYNPADHPRPENAVGIDHMITDLAELPNLIHGA
jgi:2-haloacid dehalogenase